VSTPLDKLDRDEREALKGLEDQLDAVHKRHQHDPSLELLRAAAGDALPGELQTDVSQHLAESAWSRALVEGVEEVEPALDASGEARILAHIKKQAAVEARTASTRRWLVPALVGSTLAVALVAIWVVQRPTTQVMGPAKPEATVAVAVPPPSFQLPLEKPDVKLSMAALTWRGSTTENQLLSDLKPALDAYRAGDYTTANREFDLLANKYPRAIEIPFYQGISRLFIDDPRGAIASLASAESIADNTFTDDIAWYRAVAEERAGNINEARARLETLCRGGRQRASEACEGLKRFTAR